MSVKQIPTKITISYLGMETVTVDVANANSITVKLKAVDKQEEEVLVVGYGRQKKSTKTGAIDQITGDEIRRTPQTNLQNMLADKVSGFTSIQRSGKPGAEGMRFTQHYTSTPVCAPARAMLMTGKHGGHSAIRGNFELGGFPDSAERDQKPLPAAEVTVAEMLKNKGYATAMIGKWGLGMNSTEGTPIKQGFDYYYSYLDQKQAHNFYPTHLWKK